MTAFKPFARPEHCPIVGRVVVVSGITVPLAANAWIAGKSCSHSGGCLAKYGSLDQIADCLLHALKPSPES
jgi:hypothetical protein